MIDLFIVRKNHTNLMFKTIVKPTSW